MSDRDDRSPAQVGKHARLEIAFAVRDGRTGLVQQYAEPPFRVGRTFPDDDGGAHLIVSSSAPGIFGGDELRQSVHVESGARVRLTSQSALQIHPSADRRVARLSSRYVVERNGHLSCEWDPNIPFPDARLQQQIEIDVGEGATLFWSDAVMSGREARGERWQCASLVHELRLIRGETLAYLERYAVEPGRESVAARWTGDDACYFGTILAVAPGADRATALAIYDELSQVKDARVSADVIDEGVLLVRLMAGSGPGFHAVRAHAATAVGHLIVR